MASVDALATTLERYARELPPEDLPALVGALETAKAQAWTRLMVERRAASAIIARSDGLLDATAMAARLQVPVSWLREAARTGRIPSVRVGRYVRFDPAAVERAVRGPADPPA